MKIKHLPIVIAALTLCACGGANQNSGSQNADTTANNADTVAAAPVQNAEPVADEPKSYPIACEVALKYAEKNELFLSTENVKERYASYGKEVDEHPEFKPFEKVLSNPRAMKNIATMISNSLRESEQKRILNLACLMEEALETDISKQKAVFVIKQTHESIVEIVKEHAKVHPEFINELLAAVAYADTTYVIPAQQHVR